MQITLAEYYHRIGEFLPDIEAGRKRAVLRITHQSKVATPGGGKAPEVVIREVIMVNREDDTYEAGFGLGILSGQNTVRIETVVQE